MEANKGGDETKRGKEKNEEIKEQIRRGEKRKREKKKKLRREE